MRLALQLLLICGVVLTGCVEQKQNDILPSTSEREILINNYMRCVAVATDAHYDVVTKPDLLVRQSMEHCIRARNAMIREYPKSWRENFVKNIDNKLYQREIAWIEQNRKAGRAAR